MANWLKDTFQNLVASLGTDRDKSSYGSYTFTQLSDAQLTEAYRGAWLPRKIVDIPANDATRKWRTWQADKKQITAIEAEEKRLQLRQKVREAMTKARLYGGAGIYIGVKGDRDPSLPLNPDRVQKNGLEFLTVLPARVLTAAALQDDPAMPNYGKPEKYTIRSTSAGMVEVHPSRVAVFMGAELPDPDYCQTQNQGWGDSVLQAAYSACKNSDETLANIASLIYEAKVDVLGVPGLADIMADPESRRLFIERAQLSATLKGNNGMMLRDSEETYDSKSFAFSNLDNIAQLFLQVNSGAADIPLTRLLNQAPAGMNATGESDTRNYYDKVQSEQELELTPALEVLDNCLIRSALGSRPPEIWYTWASLWQTTETERTENGKRVAETVKIISDTNLIPPDILSEAAENTLIEYGVMPGLEAAREKYGDIRPEPEGDDNADVL